MSERFHYTAYSERGRRTYGEVRAYDPEDALYQLQNEGFYVSSLLRDSLKRRRPFSARDSLSYQERFVLLSCLASSLEGGFSIESALVHLRNGTHAPKVQRLLDRILNALDEGATFTEALRSSRLFPDFWIRVLAIGEQTGDFVPLIRLLSRHLHEIHRLKAELLSSIFMPSVLLVLLAFWFCLFLVKTVPSVVLFLTQAGVPLPIPSLFYPRGELEGVLVGARFLGIGILFCLWVRQSYRMRGKVCRILDPAFLPVVGPLVYQKQFLIIAMGLKLQIEAELPLTKAFQAICFNVPDGALRRQLLQVHQKLQEGIPLPEALAHVQAIPHIAKTLISTGESNGKLPEMLDFLVRNAQALLWEQCKRLTILVRNFAILSIGILIGFLLLGFYGMLYACYSNFASPR